VLAVVLAVWIVPRVVPPAYEWTSRSAGLRWQADYMAIYDAWQDVRDVLSADVDVGRVTAEEFASRVAAIDGRFADDVRALGISPRQRKAELERAGRWIGWMARPLYIVVGAYAAVLALLRVFCAPGLRKSLLSRGYEWATAADALWLMLRIGRRAWALPPAEETTVIPGIAANVDGLLAFERMRRRHRRRGEAGA